MKAEITPEEKKLRRHIAELNNRLDSAGRLTRPDDSFDWLTNLKKEAMKKLRELEARRENS